MIEEELRSRFKENMSTEISERFSHSSDMGFVPHIVWAGVKINNIPDYVVYPKSVEDVIDLVKIARKYKVPITPYGKGTNRYGNAVPTEGGIVVDFSKMDSVEINAGDKLATVGPGATWKIVDLYAQQKGMQLRTFPSSYDSTVGGGIAGDSLGIGSYEYGFISDNVAFVDMINPKGDLVRLQGGDLAIACGAEGTTGIIVKAGIRLRPFSTTEAVTLSYESFDDVIRAIGEFYKQLIPAWHVQVRGRAISTYMAERYKAPVDPNRWNIVVMYPSSRSALVEPKLKRLAIDTGAKMTSGEWTGWWSFNHGVIAAMRTKGLLIHQHGLVEYTKLKELVERLGRQLGDLGRLEETGGFDIDIALERRETLLVNAFTMSYLKPFDKKLIYELAKNTLMMEEMIGVGGSMLAVGMFVHQYAKNRLNVTSKTFAQLGVDRYETMRSYKQQNDPNELMNPGKVFEPKERGKGVTDIVRKQKDAMSFRFAIGLAKALTSGGEVGGYQATKRYMDIFVDYAMECIDCAMCVTVCPQYRLIPQYPYAPKGMFDFVKGAISSYHINGAVDIPLSAIAEISGCHKCGLCDGVCPAKIPISTLLVKLNNMVAKKMPEETPVNIRIADESVQDVVDPSSDVVLWVGKSGVENLENAITTLRVLKALGVKVKMVGTEGDTGFLDYISGNGASLTKKVKKNAEVLSGASEVLTISPEDYKLLSEVYLDYSKILGVNFRTVITPLDLRILEVADVKGDEEIQLHVACFSQGYADDVMKKLREKGYKVRKVEGCSGAQLEANLGRRADMMARTLAERYKKLVTLCPFAAAKFKKVGVDALTLTEFLGSKMGIKVEKSVDFSLPAQIQEQLKQILLNSIKSNILTVDQLVADTVTFATDEEEYRKMIEPVITQAIDKVTEEVLNYMNGVLEAGKGSEANPLLLRKSMVDIAVSALSSVNSEPLARELLGRVKEKATDTFDEQVVLRTILTLLSDKYAIIKTKLASSMNYT
jgi:FAD/FMN-containing dehydrogenase/Fe-S oxidoreductase